MIEKLPPDQLPPPPGYPPGKTLTPSQQKAWDILAVGLTQHAYLLPEGAAPLVFTLSGGAGCGKSTLVSWLHNGLAGWWDEVDRREAKLIAEGAAANDVTVGPAWDDLDELGLLPAPKRPKSPPKLRLITSDSGESSHG